eukprot:c13878_g1_i1 orf=32-1855(+)
MVSPMKKQGWLSAAAFLIIFLALSPSYSAAAKDLYKILGVEKNASQREVQKAFHRLSLKYHPDKNPSKNAEAKFAEINNAYEVLSDEEKRKNYDLYGDEKGQARGPEPNAYSGSYSGSQKTDEGGGWNNFGYTTNDKNGYRFEQHSSRSGGEEGSQGQGNYFNFPFGGQERSFSFGFGGNAGTFQNIFDSFFSSARGKQGEGQHFSSYNQGKTGNSRERSEFEGGTQASSLVEELNVKNFQKKVLDQLDTWAVLFIPHASNDAQEKLQLLEQISRSLRGSIKVGSVNCERQKQLCEQQNMWSSKTTRLRLYSLRRNGKLSALDYTGEWSTTDVKNYCVDVLPRFSKHLDDVGFLNDEINDEESSPVAVLLTKKKDTPAMWRALSGLFYERIAFFDVQINEDNVDAIAKRFKVDSFPAIVGVYVNGETKVLASGTTLEQASSSIEELRTILEDFERKSKAAGPKKRKAKADSEVPSLTKKNFKNVCSQDTPVCVIGIHKSSRGKDKLTQILKEISQKSLIRKRQTVSSTKRPVSYSVVDGTKQLAFLNSFEKSVSESENIVLIAYKPKKGTYTFYNGPLNLESAEKFVVEVLSGDLQLRSVTQDPVLI